MVNQRQIAELVERIAKQFEPEQVILFGSYAYGSPTDDSDVDLLVVMPLNGTRTAHKEAEISLAVHGGFPMDLLVRSPEGLRERIQMNDCFIREIVEKGKVLYGATH